MRSIKLLIQSCISTYIYVQNLLKSCIITNIVDYPKNSDIIKIVSVLIMLLITIKKMNFILLKLFLKNEFETIDFYFDKTPSIDIKFYIKRQNFSHITEMIIETISDIRNMTYGYYIKNPIHMVERRLNMINAMKSTFD